MQVLLVYEGVADTSDTRYCVAPDIVHGLQAIINLQSTSWQVPPKPGVLHDPLNAHANAGICRKHPLQQVLTLI